MTSSDRELREALEPLAGDPDALRDRVLEALPNARPRPLFPMWLAAGFVGVSLGLLCGRALWHKDGQPVVSDAGIQPVAAAALRTVIGEVARRNREGSREGLEVSAALWTGDRIETQPESFATITLPDGTELRLNAASVFELTSESTLNLENGQLWAQFAPGTRWRIHHEQGTVETEGGAIDVRAEGRSLHATALGGEVRLVSRDGVARLLKPGQACSIHNGIVRKREYLRWPMHVVAWQLPLLSGTPRDELLTMAREMVELLEHPDAASMAEMTLRTFGDSSVIPLLEVLDPAKTVIYRKVRVRAAYLLRDTAVYANCDKLFELLVDPDPRIRTAMHAAIVRVTGIEHGNEEFWANATEEELLAEVEAWRMEILRYK